MKITPELVAACRETEVFRPLREAYVEALLRAMSARRLPEGALLFAAGEPGSSMIVVASGRLAVEVNGGMRVAELGRGAAVGEMAFVDPAPRSASLVALEETVVLELPRDRLSTLRTKAPQVLVALIRGIRLRVTRCLREADHRIEETFREQDEVAGIGWVGPEETEGRPLEVDPGAFKGRFGRYDADDLAKLVAFAPPVAFDIGDLLCSQGRQGESCYILVSGRVDVTRHVSGKARQLATLGRGDVVGQMVLIDSAPRTATVSAQSPVAALHVDRLGFDALAESHSPLAIKFHAQIATAGIRQLRLANERLATLNGERPVRPTPPSIGRDYTRAVLAAAGTHADLVNEIRVVRARAG